MSYDIRVEGSREGLRWVLEAEGEDAAIIRAWLRENGVEMHEDNVTIPHELVFELKPGSLTSKAWQELRRRLVYREGL